MKKLLLLLLLLPVSVKAYQTSARSAVLMDIDANRIIYKNNCNNVQSVASISKIMTAIVAIESDKLDEIVKIGPYVGESYGSGIYIKENEEIKLLDLVYGLMLRSGNDAALAIAHHVSGSLEEFVILMNKKAKEIGMKNSTFNNPSGLDGTKSIGNFSTACDMALLMSYAMKNETFQKITGTKNYKVKTNLNFYDWTNKNKLLRNYKYATGGKTGFTEIANRTLVTTAAKKNTKLVAVTLDDGNDFDDHKDLFEEAFKEYKTYKILSKGKIEIVDEKFYANREFYIKNDFYYPLKEVEAKEIILKIKLKELYNYKDNQDVGTVEVYLKDKKIHSTKLYISIDKIKINVFEKLMELLK